MNRVPTEKQHRMLMNLGSGSAGLSWPAIRGGVRPHRRMYMQILEHRGHVAAHRREDSTLTLEQVVRLREEAFAGVPLVRLAERYCDPTCRRRAQTARDKTRRANG